MMDEVFGVPLSVGTLSQLEQATAAVVAGPVEEACTYVHAQKVAHLDETSWREGGKRAWLWVAVTSWVTVFFGADVTRWRSGSRAVGRDVSRHLGPAGAFAQKYTVIPNSLSDNKLYGHRKVSHYHMVVSDCTVK